MGTINGRENDISRRINIGTLSYYHLSRRVYKNSEIIRRKNSDNVENWMTMLGERLKR